MSHDGPNSRHSGPESHGTAEVAPDDTPAIPDAHSADTAKITWSDLFGIDPHYGDHCAPEDPCQGCAEADQ